MGLALRWLDIEEAGSTPSKRAAAASADVLQDKHSLEKLVVTGTAERLQRLQDDLRTRVLADPGGVTDFRRFVSTELVNDVTRLIQQAGGDIINLAQPAIAQASELGADHVDEPLKAAQLSVGSAVRIGLDTALVNATFDNLAALLSEPMTQFRNQVVTGIRRVALAGDSRMGAIQQLQGTISGAGFDNAQYRAERIIRTEVSRIFNEATFSRLSAMANEFPFLRKGWRATADKRTRLTHLQAGKAYARGSTGIIPINVQFVVGAAKLRFPVDPLVEPHGKVGAAETIMCRCNAFVDFDLNEYAQFARKTIRLAVGGPGPEPGPEPQPVLPPPPPKRLPVARVPRARPAVTAESTRAKLAKQEAKDEAARAKFAQTLRPARQRINGEYDRAMNLFYDARDAAKAAGRDWMTDPAIVELKRQLTEMDRQLADLNRQQLAFNEKQWAARRKLVYVDADKRAKFGQAKVATDDLARVFNKGQIAEIMAGAEEFKKLVADGGAIQHFSNNMMIAGRNGELRIQSTPQSRSFASKTLGVFMGRADAGTVVHEIGHIWEYSDDLVHRHAVGFLVKRSTGLPIKTLKALSGGEGYSDNEWATDDKFDEVYSGKWYTNGPKSPEAQAQLRKELANKPDLYLSRVVDATEIVSMGLERMYRDPVAFAKADPEYFDFIWNLQRRNWDAIKSYDLYEMGNDALSTIPLGKGGISYGDR